MDAKELIRDFDPVKAKRDADWLPHWREIGERIDPDGATAFSTSGTAHHSQGEKRMREVYDATAMRSVYRAVAVLDSHLTPSTEPWHFLDVDNEELAENREVRLWFEDTNRRVRKWRGHPDANWHAQNQKVFHSLITYGNACLFVDELAGELGIRYHFIHLSEIYIEEDHQGRIIRVWRLFSLTARQAVRVPMFRGKLPSKIEKAAGEKPDDVFQFLHCVERRAIRDTSRADYKAMPYASYYLSYDCSEMIDEGGYWTNPYIVTRYATQPGEVYGRGPGSHILPDVKTLNEAAKAYMTQIHRALNPPWMVPNDDEFDAPSMKPGSLVWGGIDDDGNERMKPMKFGEIQVGKDFIEAGRANIMAALNLDLFDLLIDKPGMTATEVLERKYQKIAFLYPVLSGQYSSYAGPLLVRELDILSAQGAFKEMPRDLAKVRGRYRTRYSSPLTRAMDSGEAAGFLRSWNEAAQISQVTQDPSVMFIFNAPAAIRWMARKVNNVPEMLMRSDEEVAAMLESQKQQQEMDQMINAAPGGAAMVNALAKAEKARAA